MVADTQFLVHSRASGNPDSGAEPVHSGSSTRGRGWRKRGWHRTLIASNIGRPHRCLPRPARKPGQEHSMRVRNHFPRLLAGDSARRRFVCPRRTAGERRRPRHDQAARHADRRREGGLSPVRIPFALRRDRRDRTRAGRRRGQEPGREAGTRAGVCFEPHPVPAAGQGRSDHRHDERHEGAQDGGRYREARLLRRRLQRHGAESR